MTGHQKGWRRAEHQQPEAVVDLMAALEASLAPYAQAPEPEHLRCEADTPWWDGWPDTDGEAA